MKTYNMYETTLRRNIGSFWRNQRVSNFPFPSFFFFFLFPIRIFYLAPGEDAFGWRLGGPSRGTWGGVNVNEDPEAEIWGSYCFELSVRYEKELKGRLLKSVLGVAGPYVNGTRFRAIICHCGCCCLFVCLFIYLFMYLFFQTAFWSFSWSPRHGFKGTHNKASAN